MKIPVDEGDIAHNTGLAKFRRKDLDIDEPGYLFFVSVQNGLSRMGSSPPNMRVVFEIRNFLRKVKNV